MKRVIGYFRREAVFTISLLLALASLPFNAAGVPYVQYVDWDVIMLLFSLMGVVAGFRGLGIFDRLAQTITRRGGNLRRTALLLMSISFFLSMLVTNDVALITMVPLTVTALALAAPEAVAPVVVLETIAANLGSMATPMGNPQNLYIFTAFELGAGEFVRIMLPLTALSYVLLALCCLRLPRKPIAAAAEHEVCRSVDYRLGGSTLTLIYAALAALCLLALCRIIPKYICCAAVMIMLAVVSPRVLLRVDYSLLATFTCFFIFVGNVGEIPAVSSLLRGVISGRELPIGALVSQVISNVPATFMLSPFAGDIPALLRGVNIGGLGTPVASLASLIALKHYSASQCADIGRFMRLFLALNFGFLTVLLAAAYIM